jgi:hypothetical protein
MKPKSIRIVPQSRLGVNLASKSLNICLFLSRFLSKTKIPDLRKERVKICWRKRNEEGAFICLQTKFREDLNLQTNEAAQA